ncbi:MAG: class I SAM-dependent RNA methyltransferase [Anaerolineales bacterium]|nr:class I SAM-dependent RNA methyltransferase [Anaerolineales bacterium]MDW8161423.1 class I SAM-dependent RNA methyltransferase [Anaerolineales bacterium]
MKAARNPPANGHTRAWLLGIDKFPFLVYPLLADLSKKASVMPAEAQVEVTLREMVYGGAALGRLADGRALFVPYALPSERALVEIVQEKAHYARGRLVQVLVPSPKRIQPRCPHFGECGGCHYQHLSYEEQVSLKAQLLVDQLRRIGAFHALPELAIYPSPSEWHYRNSLQFHLTPEGKLGFRRAQSHETLPIQQCFLPLPPLIDLWQQIELDPEAGVERVELRCDSDGNLLLVLESDHAEPPEVSVEELPISVVHLSPAGSLVLAGSEYLWMEIKEQRLRLSAGAFFQVNAAVAGQIVDYLLAHLKLSPSDALLDVYCGGGLYSVFLAPRVGRLIGIESSPYACRDFEFNLDTFEQVELYEATAEQVLAQLDLRPQTILLDPPRSGLSQTVREALARLAPPQIAYISCDPATFARDLRYLAQRGYRLEQLAFFDMFPQTYHIETVGILRT